MEIIYRADDGREFYNEDDCTEYEENQLLEAAGNDFVALDARGGFLDPKSPFFHDEVIFLKIDTEAACECIVKRLDRDGSDSDGLEGPGTYVWGDDWGFRGWTEAQEILDSLQEKVDDFNGLLEKLNR